MNPAATTTANNLQADTAPPTTLIPEPIDVASKGIDSATTPWETFDYNQLQFGFVRENTELNFQSTLSTKTTVTDVARDIYTFDPRLSLRDEQVFNLFKRNRNRSWPSYSIPAIERQPTTWARTDDYIDN